MNYYWPYGPQYLKMQLMKNTFGYQLLMLCILFSRKTKKTENPFDPELNLQVNNKILLI